MKKWLTGALVAACFVGSSPAMAKDSQPYSNPSTQPYNNPPSASRRQSGAIRSRQQQSSAQNFRGLYVGGNIGMADYSAERSDTTNLIAGGGTFSSDTGVIGGVQAGYDIPVVQNVVVGAMADFGWSNAKADTHISPNANQRKDLEGRLNWRSSVRARIGVVPNPRLMVYVSGGPSVSEIKSTFTRTILSTGTQSVSFKDHAVGWTAGAGLEMAVTPKWSVGADLSYTNALNKKRTFDFPTSPVTTQEVTMQSHDQAWTGRVGLNYRFGF